MGGIVIQQGGIGDNKEFSVVTTGKITIYIQNEGGLTSANDDVTNRNYYFNTSRSRRKYVLRIDQTVKITKINGETLTDPISVVIGDGSLTPDSGMHKEEFDVTLLQNMEIDVLTANTNIKLRVY